MNLTVFERFEMEVTAVTSFPSTCSVSGLKNTLM